MTMVAGAMKAKDEPKYAGALPLVIRMNSSVPMPFMNSTIAGLMPNINGTSTDAPNMANMCWMESGTSSRGGTLSST